MRVIVEQLVEWRLPGETEVYIAFVWAPSYGELTDCLPQIIQPVQCKRCRLLPSTLSTHVQTSITGDKPIGQQITNKIHPDRSRSQKCCLLLCTYPLHSIKCSHSCAAILFLETWQTWNFTLHARCQIDFRREWWCLASVSSSFSPLGTQHFNFFCPTTTIFAKFIYSCMNSLFCLELWHLKIYATFFSLFTWVHINYYRLFSHKKQDWLNV
jgi:hypothetical protein